MAIAYFTTVSTMAVRSSMRWMRAARAVLSGVILCFFRV
jgi:hypothetical protein